jgi:hypothetical protein
MRQQLRNMGRRDSLLMPFARNVSFRKRKARWAIIITSLLLLLSLTTYAQWTPLATASPDKNNGVMLLLSNGTIMCKSDAGGGDGVGDTWNLLTPDASGSYVNGTWSTIDRMAKTRLYFSSQVLQDGRVFVAGGEYGSGGNFGEVYDPVLDQWGSEINYGVFISDANSEILPNGRVLVAPVGNRPNTFIWNPADNTFVAGPQNLGNTNESAWVKLPDNSILYVRTNGTISERYMPGTNTWNADATVPVPLYEPLGSETGAAFMLPDGRAFFLGGNSNTAYYTPSGTAADGSWTAGPLIPNSLSAPDAAAAMMRDGKILCAVSPTLTCCDGGGNNIFNTPTSFYIFDYAAGANGTFTSITAPDGNPNHNIPAYYTNMLCLPNGQILYSQQNSKQYYVYTPGAQLAANRPFINDIAQHNDGTFTLTGKDINGWSEGAGYGDDWQMNTNYPIVQLSGGGNVYYARSYNWSSTGIYTGIQTTDFSLPAGLPAGTYQLRVIANGIASDPISFCTPHVDANPTVTSNYNGRDVSCFNACDGSVTANAIGAILPTYSWSNGATTASVSGLCPGTYSVTVTNLGGVGCSATRSVTIHNTPALHVNPTATSNYNGFNVSCNGGNDGTAAANASGGTTPYHYDWSNGQHTSTATGLSATTYTVNVTDANGCMASGNVTLTEPPKLTSTAAPTSNYNGYNVRCHGGSDGVAEAYPVGGVSPYTYSWSNGQTTKIATGLSAANYSVTITDKNGCTTVANTGVLTEPPQLTINAGANKTVYYGYPDSSCATLTATGMGGGVPPYVITWSSTSNPMISHAASIVVCPMATTVYTVTIADANGCSFSDQVTVCVIDVRCGNKLDKVTISHMTGNKKDPCNTLCIDINGAKNHFIQHPTDQLAACGTVKTCNDGGLRITRGTTEKATLVMLQESLQVKTFPNPFTVTTTVRITNNVDDVAQVSVCDISGKEIFKLYNGKIEANKEYNLRLDGRLLTSGIYLLTVKTEHGSKYTGKLVIAK